MPRQPRITAPDAVYHVTTKGLDGQRIFLDSLDYQAFAQTLTAAVNLCGIECLALCQMHNHFHLLVRSPRENLPTAMRRLNGPYAMQFNKRHARTGPVFQRRYDARLIRSEQHLLAAIRYLFRYLFRNLLETDPPLCTRPEEWPHGSYRATLGLALHPPWLRDQWLLALFAPDTETARRRLKAYVDGEAVSAAHR